MPLGRAGKVLQKHEKQREKEDKNAPFKSEGSRTLTEQIEIVPLFSFFSLSVLRRRRVSTLPHVFNLEQVFQLMEISLHKLMVALK